MGFANSTEITVYADDAYHYSVVAEDMGCCINYYEQGKPAPFTRITFGNVKEMEAVAKAILQAVNTYRTMLNG